MATKPAKLVWVMVNTGGVGKTYFSQALEAISAFQGISMSLASHDAGNHALVTMIGGEVRVGTIDYHATAETAKNLLRHQARNQVIVIDTGANSSNVDYNSLDFAVALAKECHLHDREFIPVIPSASSKSGGLQTALETIEILRGLGLNPHLLLNNANGAADFGPNEQLASLSYSVMPSLQPGFQAVRSEFNISLQSLIANPPRGYANAAKHFSDWLNALSKTQIVREIFDLPETGMMPHLPQAAQLNFVVTSKWQASDRALECNYESALREADLMRADLPDHEILKSAKSYREAVRSYWQCRPQ